jgi:hypothetical protein
MRTTTMALLCSLAACAPMSDRENDWSGPDAGVDDSSASGACDDLEIVNQANLTISGSSGFADLPTTCWKLNGKLTLTGPAITSLDKLGDLRGVNDLEINDTDLTRFNTRSQIDVTGDIYIHHNDLLTEIANVLPKGSVRNIRIESNAALTGLGNVSRATVVSGATAILGNAKLAAADLSSAQRLEGGLTIQDNGALTSINLSSLQSVGNLTIARNALLTTVGTMSSMTNVHGTFTIDGNNSLTTLGTLGNAILVDVGISITNNAKLSDLGQLAHASRVFGTVNISNNLQLDVTRAHDIGCCVQTGAFTASNNRTNQCSGNHYCLNTQQNCFR